LRISKQTDSSSKQYHQFIFKENCNDILQFDPAISAFD